MVSRRSFLKLGGAAGAALYLTTYFGGVKRVFSQIPGGTLDPHSVPKYMTPMLIPPVMPTAGKIKLQGGKNADYYEISMKQFPQQILPAGLPATTVWGYGAVTSDSKSGLLLHNAPSLTIEAKWNTPVRVKWINDLVDANGNYLPHLLPVDQTLHWANPPGGTTGRDTRPDFHRTANPRPLHRPGADGHARARRGRRGRRERRLRRGLVPAGRQRHPSRVRRPTAPGTTSSPARRRPASAPPGDRATPPSSTRTPTAPRPSGTTTTRWA